MAVGPEAAVVLVHGSAMVAEPGWRSLSLSHTRNPHVQNLINGGGLRSGSSHLPWLLNPADMGELICMITIAIVSRWVLQLTEFVGKF